MKITTILHDRSNLNNNHSADKFAVIHTYKLGLDVDLNNIVVAVQCDHGAIKPAQKFSRPRLIEWVRQQVSAGEEPIREVRERRSGDSRNRELTAPASDFAPPPLRRFTSKEKISNKVHCKI